MRARAHGDRKSVLFVHTEVTQTEAARPSATASDHFQHWATSLPLTNTFGRRYVHFIFLAKNTLPPFDAHIRDLVADRTGTAYTMPTHCWDREALSIVLRSRPNASGWFFLGRSMLVLGHLLGIPIHRLPVTSHDLICHIRRHSPQHVWHFRNLQHHTSSQRCACASALPPMPRHSPRLPLEVFIVMPSVNHTPRAAHQTLQASTGPIHMPGIHDPPSR
ncbi:hypothetical protein Hypma_004455 [Hypsizygus marmoreus]|uniref:Uncharacterized protein n=1 Tax=Hypsizygus marmoreus TaxID=39966 RepID=A0A369K8H4_HYPMA|nr:hypothetical protein Hypma_004455 [Hypsizygus marmoreus]